MNMFKSIKMLRTIALLLSTAVIFNACKEEEEVFPAPTIAAGAAANAKTGDVVKITATLNAPGGLKTLTVLKNGQTFESKALTGETTLSYTKDYTVESLPVGSTVVFTFQATDSKDQASTIATQIVTVSAVPSKPIVDVSGTLEGNISWTKGNIYRLKGFVRVGEDAKIDGTPTKTGTLTIEAGTVIIGERSSKATLIIQRGSKIIANGTADAPIVFTSERAIGEREAGDWGGLVICGKGLNNLTTGGVKGVAELEGQYGAFHGGTDNADNSGSLKYVRVEYAGIPINPNQEVNSFTFGSVGSGTTMEYLQASYGGDDSFEWFGGAVNGKYLIAYRGLDDDFDIDNGFSGNLQYGIGLRGAAVADQSGSNGFEIDNDGSGTANTPVTSATLSNFSLIGPKLDNTTAISVQYQNGMHLRRNAQVKIHNTVVTGFPNGVFIDPSGAVSTLQNAADGKLVLNRVVVSGVKSWGSNSFGAGAGNPNGFAVRDVNTATTPVALANIGTQKPSEWFAAQPGNKILTDWTLTGLSNTLFVAGTPTFTVGASATETLTKGGQAPAGAFFTTTDFIGAFKDADWTAKWANFNSGTTDYTKVQ
ncbi:Ig-like domain repeat protein [Runella aurantiaca]|uniref:Ig-like domain repeat protein n=1 Tax=Runella aurantiaca TaxID=2282308 RepID=A0A369IDF4_9BACT|nr:Ig-like domain repeat protein [Runella aurantiaca]RDB05264.1 Ig-like domain repeat protein [Runella aurantiaca]